MQYVAGMATTYLNYSLTWLTTIYTLQLYLFSTLYLLM